MTKPNVLDIPVEFGGVSIGEATARLGIRANRSVLNLMAADEIFCGHRLSGRVVLGGEDDQPGQGRLVDDLEHMVDGVFDCKRIGVNPTQISTGLTFNLADVEIAELAKFSKGSGRLIINDVGELPEDSEETADGLSDETPESLRADGAWQHVELDTLFHGALLKSLKDGGLDTVGDLANYTASNKRLTDLGGVGEGKAAKIKETMLAFWEANPHADQSQPELTENEATATTDEPPAASGDWPSLPIEELGLTTGVNDMLAEVKVTTLGGLVELKEAIDGSKAVWPKGIGPAKAEDILKRLESVIDKHQPEPAAT